AWEDYQHWVASDKAVLKRLNYLLNEVQRTPYQGSGKPEALKHDFKGCWSRRITVEHRLVYRIQEDQIIVLQARYHY
ncbi:MAG: Txe/YoeB family addiction module toxin, partial [Schleiferiaceae bacterium]|nr:Txe/YoeB family addiction module toxin [Schleiferiaceae bacterium]